MTTDEKTTYQVYAKPLTEQSIFELSEERFSRATSGYVLIYTNAAKGDDWTLISESEIGRLTNGDREWLSDCNFIIMAENLRDNERNIAADMTDRLDAFETALKAEKDKRDKQEG